MSPTSQWKKVYTMAEVAQVTIPMPLAGVGDFFSTLDDLLQIKKNALI
jgi:hypothetical protein